MLRQVREDYVAHQCDWSLPGLRALAVHRFGGWSASVRSSWYGWFFERVYKTLYIHVRNHYHIELPRTTVVGRRLRIGHQGAIVIHPRSSLGDDCVLRQNVTIGAANEETADRGPRLMNRVEVGCGAVIVGGVTIGDDVRIGPNAVITMNIPAGSVVVAAAPRIINLKKAPAPSRDAAGVGIET